MFFKRPEPESFASFKLFSDYHENLIHCSILKKPLRKISNLTLLIDIGVVTAGLLLMVNHTATFY